MMHHLHPRKAWSLLLLVLLLWLPVLAVAATEAGLVLATRGEVAAVAADKQMRVLKRGDPLYEGDTVVTGEDSFARIRFSDGGSLHLRATTGFKISEYAYQQEGKKDVGRFDLLAGAFRTVTGAVGRDDKEAYSVKTPVTTIGIRGTDHFAGICAPYCDESGQQGGTTTGEGLFTATFVGQTLIGGILFGPGEAGFTNLAGVTIRLPALLLFMIETPNPTEDSEYEGVGPGEGGPTGDGGGDDGSTPGGGDGEALLALLEFAKELLGYQDITWVQFPDLGSFFIPERPQQVVVLICPR